MHSNFDAPNRNFHPNKMRTNSWSPELYLIMSSWYIRLSSGSVGTSGAGSSTILSPSLGFFFSLPLSIKTLGLIFLESICALMKSLRSRHSRTCPLKLHQSEDILRSNFSRHCDSSHTSTRTQIALQQYWTLADNPTLQWTQFGSNMTCSSNWNIKRCRIEQHACSRMKAIFSVFAIAPKVSTCSTSFPQIQGC